MKKKLTALALVVVLLAVAVVGGSLAYFTDTDAKTNTMVIGNVSIIQNETDYEGNDFVDDQVLLPMGDDPAWAEELVEAGGDTFKVFDSENVIEKVVNVTNEGTQAAYVRTIVALEAGKTSEMANDLWYNYIAITDNSDGTDVIVVDNDLYVDINGTYYIIVVYNYAKELAAGATSVPSLTGVALYKETTQEVIEEADFGEKYEVMVLSQAVQSADMGDDAAAALDEAFGEVNAVNVVEWFTAA